MSDVEKELKNLYIWKGDITVEQKVLASEQKALKEMMKTQFGTTHDKLDTVTDTLSSSVKGFQNRLDKHEKENVSDFTKVNERVVDSEKKIIKMLAVGGFILIVLGWIANAIIQHHFAQSNL